MLDRLISFSPAKPGFGANDPSDQKEMDVARDRIIEYSNRNLKFVVKNLTKLFSLSFSFHFISFQPGILTKLGWAVILSQVIKLQIHAASPDFYSNILAPRRRNCRKEISRNYSLRVYHVRLELELNQNSRPKREKNQEPSMVPHFLIDGPKVLVPEFSSGGARRRELGEFSSSGTGFEPDQKK